MSDPLIFDSHALLTLFQGERGAGIVEKWLRSASRPSSPATPSSETSAISCGSVGSDGGSFATGAVATVRIIGDVAPVLILVGLRLTLHDQESEELGNTWRCEKVATPLSFRDAEAECLRQNEAFATSSSLDLLHRDIQSV